VVSQITKQQRLIFILLLGLSMCLQPFTIDPYLASYPAIEKDFNVSAALIQFSMTGVTLGFAFGQIFAGTLSDAIGRRRPMIVAIALYALAALGMLWATNIETFIALRTIMAIGASAAGVLANAVVRDLYSGLPMMKMLGRVFLVQGLSPIFGPIVGAWLSQLVLWREVFGIFAGFGSVVALLAVLFLKETLHAEDRKDSAFAGMGKRFAAVLRDRIYIGLLIVSVAQTVSLFAYLNVVPFLFRDSGYGLSVGDFGFWFSFNSLMSVIGVQIGARLGARFKTQWMLVAVVATAVAAGLALAILGFIEAPFAVAEFGFALLILCFGATIPMIQTLALTPHGHEAGTAASLLGVSNFLVTSLFSPLYTLVPLDNAAPLAMMMGGAYLVGLLSLIFIVRPKTVPDLAG
jgi:DHA1 family bicyclomycin/chloramphenicol resistance-like MFS transporter